MSNVITVTSDKNFMRVFRQPLAYPESFCFNGGHPVTLQMVDWFYPIAQEKFWGVESIQMTLEQWLEQRELLQKFISQKIYAEKFPLHTHLAITDFGEAFIIPRAGQ